MKKIQLFLVMLLVSCLTVSAQSLSVTGKVTGADDGAPVIGATIKVKGTTIAVPTDVNGMYKITIPASAEKVLEISYIGLKTVYLEVAQSGTYNVVMENDTMVIEEVVVTGYGNYTKREYTGAAASVSSARTADVPTVSVQGRIAGALPGIQITSKAGQPGAVESVRIRGMSSINAGNEPLYVIDGVPMTVGDASGFSYNESGNSMLSTINSNDIESMTVIKDAAAASLYGSRAANGVIVITTKRGKSGKTRFNVKADGGVVDMAINYRPVLGGEDRRKITELSLYNYAKYDQKKSEADSQKYVSDNIEKYASKPWSGWTDWKDLLFRTGVNQTYEVSAQGGNDKTKFFSSISYVDQQGITKQSEYNRVTGRLNLTHTAGKLTYDATVMFASASQSVGMEGTSYGSAIMSAAMTCSPSDYAYNEDGSLNFLKGFSAIGKATANPVASQEYNYDKSVISRVNGIASAKYDIVDGLWAKQVIAYDFTNSNNSVWWDPRSNDGRAAQGVFQRYMINDSRLNSTSQLGYNKTFGGKHNLNLLFSFESEKQTYDYTYSQGENFPTYQLEQISNAAKNRSASNKYSWTMLSYVGKLDYNYASKYYFSAAFRSDGSSRLAPDKRWGNFWSVSGSWRLTNEEFMKGISNVLTDAKIRASYGVNGTQPNDKFGYMGLYGFTYKYNGGSGSKETQVPNTDLTWEKSNSFDVGFDVSLWNRLNITFDFYNKDTKDLLVKKPVSRVTGFTEALLNTGEMRNRGFEIDVKGVIIDKTDFNWAMSINLAHNKNTLLKLDDTFQQMVNNDTGNTTDQGAGNLIHRVNNPYYSFYLYEYAGVDKETGMEMYYKNDGTANARETTTNIALAKRIIAGSPEPKVTGGITNTLVWKNLDFGFTFTYSIGGKLFDQASARWIGQNGSSLNRYGNVPSYVKIEDTWKNPGDESRLPMFSAASKTEPSTRWMMSTDHLRLKNVTLGYKLPKQWVTKAGLEKVRVYASASNLLTIMDKDMYLDPETQVSGMTRFQTPALRIVTFGLEIGF